MLKHIQTSSYILKGLTYSLGLSATSSSLAVLTMMVGSPVGPGVPLYNSWSWPGVKLAKAEIKSQGTSVLRLGDASRIWIWRWEATVKILRNSLLIYYFSNVSVCRLGDASGLARWINPFEKSRIKPDGLNWLLSNKLWKNPLEIKFSPRRIFL